MDAFLGGCMARIIATKKGCGNRGFQSKGRSALWGSVNLALLDTVPIILLLLSDYLHSEGGSFRK